MAQKEKLIRKGLWFAFSSGILFLLFLFGFRNHPETTATERTDLLERTEQLIRHHPDSAYMLLQTLLKEAGSSKEPLTAGVCHLQIGQIFYHYGNYSQSVAHHLRAEKIFRESKDQEKLGRSLNSLGRVYYANKQPDKAAALFEEALQINTSIRSKPGMALTYGNIGHLYEKRLAYDSAFMFQQMALALYAEVGDSLGMAKIYENMGSIFEDRGRFDTALHCFEQALLINSRNRDEIAQIEVLNNLGDVYRKTGRYDDGIRFTRKALALALKTQSQNGIASAYRDLGRGFELLRNFDSAYYYNERSRSLVEQIYSSTGNRQIALLETVYEFEKKNSQIARLALDKKINNLVTLAISLVVILLCVLGAVVISRQRMRIRNEKALNQQNAHLYEKDRELMQAELRNQYLEEEKLRSVLESRSKELSSHTLHLIQKNQLLEELRSELQKMVAEEKRDQKKQLKALIQKISASFSQDNYWDDFRAIFDEVHQTFFTNLKQHADNLTPAELRLVALLRMNLSSADMSTLLGISQDSLRVARYRLRKKLPVAEGESLTAFIQNL
ncbi:MAG TPA: tetratricopeptide repeat protein [Flavisolibacter sp.]|nr:tetratricopeptide repeat protein [Flavisolibacter sp.]